MQLRDIPPADWNSFLEDFSQKYRYWPVYVEQSDIRDGLSFKERAAPLLAISHDATADAITIAVSKAPTGEATHQIVHPVEMMLEEDDEGAVQALHVGGPADRMVLHIPAQGSSIA